jgi:hypothetical protein
MYMRGSERRDEMNDQSDVLDHQSPARSIKQSSRSLIAM